jgi:hypothetical protein
MSSFNHMPLCQWIQYNTKLINACIQFSIVWNADIIFENAQYPTSFISEQHQLYWDRRRSGLVIIFITSMAGRRDGGAVTACQERRTSWETPGSSNEA